MVREVGIEPATFGSGGITTVKPMCHKSFLANSFADLNPEIRHLFWSLFWLQGEFIPKGIRPFGPKDTRPVGAERLVLCSGDDC
jgi:hypothetical protein